MKKSFLILILLFFISLSSFAHQVYDAEWCRKNGGKIEFDVNRNIRFNCITLDIFAAPYIEKIYNIVCIPYTASIIRNETPLFLKLVNSYESGVSTMFDEFNYKMTENEFIRYI